MDDIARNNAHELLMNSLRSVQELLSDPLVQEVMINAPNDVWVERAGVGISKTDICISDVEIRSTIRLLASLEDKDVRDKGKDSIVDARITGFRFAAAMKPTSLNGPSISIRKHSPVHLGLEDYVKQGAVSEEMAALLRSMIIEKKNVLVAGGTSSGKTTFVNALIGEVDGADRVVTIEDTQELAVKAPNWVALVSNEQEGVTTRDLVRLSLRFRPDRIIVGEVRGAEAFDLLDASNTGHDGCMATLHANDSHGALSRFESLVLRSGINWPHNAIKAQIADSFDYVVHMARVNGKRLLKEILAVKGFNYSTGQYETETIFALS